jgi:ESS family glutamate:Na+ symporter
MRTIPPPILIGALANVALTFIGVEPAHLLSEYGVFRDTLLVIFFICVGLSLSFGNITVVLKPICWVIGASMVLIIGQNVGAIVIAQVFGEHPHTGVLLGSVSFVGGLGSAVAWGSVLEARGMLRATPIGVAGAMLGLVVGAIIAGPFGDYLRGGSYQSSSIDRAQQSDLTSSQNINACYLRKDLRAWLYGIIAIGVAFTVGQLFQVLLSHMEMVLPRFLSGMLAAVGVVVLAPESMRERWRPAVGALESRVLNLFLVITFATLDYRSLVGMGSQVLTTATFQVLFTVLVAWLVVFIPISRLRTSGNTIAQQRAEAAAIAAAVVGFGLSSLSVAIAVLSRMSARSKPLPQARQTIAITGAGIVDLLNAIGIGICLWWIG